MVPAPLLATLNRDQLASVLVVSEDDTPSINDQPGGIDVHRLGLDELLEDNIPARQELVFLSSSCLNLDKSKAIQAIAKSRDQLSSKVLIEVQSESSVLEESDFLALGFSRYAEVEEENRTLRYYYFDLKTYKPVPDWLNPKFWANPQNWGRFRW